MGRTIVTLVSFAFLDFTVDDGYDYEYTDYHIPAVNAFRNGSVSWICSKWKSYLQEQLDSIRVSDFPGGLENIISEKTCELENFNSLKGKLDFSLLHPVNAAETE